MTDRRQQDTLEQEEYAADRMAAEMQVDLFLYKAERAMATHQDVESVKHALRLFGVNL
jgi:hypothetical protein